MLQTEMSAGAARERLVTLGALGGLRERNVLKGEDFSERIVDDLLLQPLPLVLDGGRGLLEAGLETGPGGVSHLNRVFENRANEIRDRNPQIFGKSLQLTLQHRRNAGMKHPFFLSGLGALVR